MALVYVGKLLHNTYINAYHIYNTVMWPVRLCESIVNAVYMYAHASAFHVCTYVRIYVYRRREEETHVGVIKCVPAL